MNPIESYSFQLTDGLLGADSILSLEFLPINSNGHIEIKISMDIKFSTNKVESCIFYIGSELGLIERFGKRLKAFTEKNGLQEVSLH